MPSFVIHAGLPKTATTYLQECFAANSGWLHSQGIYYPELGREDLHGHHNIARALRGENIDAAWSSRGIRSLLEELLTAREPVVLLSSEIFSSLDNDSLQVLQEVLAQCRVDWVLYLRRRSDLCLSRWQEEVKHGATDTLMDFIARQSLGFGDVLRPEDAIRTAADVFGLTSLRLVVYDAVLRSGEDLFQHFLRRILSKQIDPLTVQIPAPSNLRMPTHLIECIRAINAARSTAVGLRRMDRAYAERVADHLQSTEPGRALAGEFLELLTKHGEPLRLDGLDDQWQRWDAEILHICRAQVVTKLTDGALFPPAELKQATVLPLDQLYRAIPAQRLDRVAELIAGAAGSPGSVAMPR